MIIKYDEENHSALIEFENKDDILMWAEGDKLRIHVIYCPERPQVIDECLFTELE